MRHPSENLIKCIIAQRLDITDEQLVQELVRRAILPPLPDDDICFPQIRDMMGIGTPDGPPEDFNPLRINHRASVQYLRDQGLYQFFHPTAAMKLAIDLHADPSQRIYAEQMCLTRLPQKELAKKLNDHLGTAYTAETLELFRSFFWNPRLLSFDELALFLYGRSQVREQTLALYRSDAALARYHLKMEQKLTGREMLERAQAIAFFNLEEVAQLPGITADKINAINGLSRTLVTLNESMQSGSGQVSDVLALFSKFRMNREAEVAGSVDELLKSGTISSSPNKMLEAKEEEKS